MRAAWILIPLLTLLPGVAALTAAAPQAPPAAAADPKGLEFFEKKVRPLLAEQCLGCHTGPKAAGKLDLGSREKLLGGGELGPALVPGDPEKSLVVQAVRYTGEVKMPPRGKLPAEQIETLTEWVRMGAPWPSQAQPQRPAAPGKPSSPTTPGAPVPGKWTMESGRKHWSFQPVREPAIPAVKNRAWVKSPIDAFVLAKLEAAGLKPAPPADPRTLIRRVTYDLTGLPPTPEEVDAFLRDCEGEPLPAEHAEERGKGQGKAAVQSTSEFPRVLATALPQSVPSVKSVVGSRSNSSSASFRVFRGQVPEGAYRRLVERLLASPAYGERWARHWLDVARYADSNGLDENTAFGNAWRYRDWVIQALNQDKPYDQFVREQLAGDLLPAASEQERYDHLIATGFLGLGPKVLAEPDKQKMVMDIVDEQIDTTGKAFLGLTLGCARCHDHKFDPVPTKDYYGLAGIFKSTRTMETLNTVARVLERPLAPEARTAARKAFEDEERKLDNRINKTKDAEEKTKLMEELKTLREHAPPPVPMAIAVEEANEIGNVKVHIRGNTQTLGDEAPRQFLRVIAGESQSPLPADRSGRLEFAQWITRPDNPLTARIIVNRVWQHHFGEGIVRSPDNFGLLGDRPTHPELLDYLAFWFTQPATAVGSDGEKERGRDRGTDGSRTGASGGNDGETERLRDRGTETQSGLGWSLKKLHRLILLSSTYQQSSALPPSASSASSAVSSRPKPQSIDPENRLLWRMNRRRLEVEAIRDGMLAVSGQIDRTMGGSLLTTPNFGYVTNDQSNNGAQYAAPRRSIYLPVIRNAVYEVFQVFDFVEPSFLNGKRSSTTVSPQALFLMNGKLVLDESRALAEQLLALPSADDESRVKAAYLRAYGRAAAPDEVQSALDYVRGYSARLAEKGADAEKARKAAWQSLCQVIFASSEFVTID